MAIDRINATALLDGGITADDIASGAIHTAKIADGAITTAKIQDGNITVGKLASSGTLPALDGSNLTGVDPADGSITSAKLDTNIAVDGTFTVDGGSATINGSSGSSTVTIATSGGATGKLHTDGGVFDIGSSSGHDTRFLRDNAANGTLSSGGWQFYRADGSGGSLTRNSGTTVSIERNASAPNFLEFRQPSDNGQWQGIIFTDNNQGGYMVHGNGGNYDGMKIGSYNYFELEYGSGSSTSGLGSKTSWLRKNTFNGSAQQIGNDGGKTYIGANASGTMMKLNDDAWFSDPQNGQVNFRNGGDNNWGTLNGFLNNQSSRDEKRDIVELTATDEETIANDFLNTSVYKYNWKAEEQNYWKKHIGPIAEEVPLYLSGIETKKSISSADMDGALMSALRHALRKIAELETRIQTLENA